MKGLRFMFYLKHEGKKLEINEDNVYTVCPQCGKEYQVDICDIFAGGNADLYGTSVYCEACSIQRERDREAGKPVSWPE